MLRVSASGYYVEGAFLPPLEGHNEDEPMHAGLSDLNRFNHYAQ